MEIPKCVSHLASSRFIKILKSKEKRRMFSPSKLVLRGEGRGRIDGPC